MQLLLAICAGVIIAFCADFRVLNIYRNFLCNEMSPSEFRNASCGWTLHGSMAGAFLCRLSVVTTALFLVVCCNLPSIVTDTQITEGWVTLGRICKFSAPRSRCTNAKCQRRAQKMHFEYKNVTSFRGLRPLDQGLFS